MASDLNKVMIIGRLVRDPEIRYTQSGTAVANFSIASNKVYVQAGEKKEQVNFFSVVAWTKLGELIVQYCKKGHRIGIEGNLQSRSWEDKDGNKRSTVEITADNVQFLTPKSESSGNETSAGTQVDNQPNFDDLPDDDF